MITAPKWLISTAILQSLQIEFIFFKYSNTSDAPKNKLECLSLANISSQLNLVASPKSNRVEHLTLKMLTLSVG